jgi:hypothetical protein
MALSKEIMGGGFSGGQASALGGVYGTVAAAGSTQGTATAVTMSMCVVTAADGTKGVILTGQPGDELTLFNNSASTLKVYGPTGAAIAVPGTGLGSANAAYSHTTYATCKYRCFTSTQWVVNKSA